MDALERIFRSLDYPPRLKKKSWERRMPKRISAKVAERQFRDPDKDARVMQKFRDRQMEYERRMMQARNR